MSVLRIAKKVLYQFCSQTNHQYKLLSSTDSSALNLTLHQFQHTATDARIYHFQNNDPERAFATIIKTLPQNNKGCPHILEHLACCGSQKYPIRDPFFNMIKRSVNTYMNAWTGDDFTAYPFASANRTDWDNLYKVYLDMAFQPLLNKLDFRQEGWRFEVDEDAQKQIKGIVLNEMKGAYQDADRQLILALNRQLFRGTPYAYDSGGDPRDIVELKYAQLRQMYEHYYHPSNMSFFYYGKGHIEEQLSFLDQEYLRKFSDKSQLYRQPPQALKKVTLRHQDIVSYTSQCNSIAIHFDLGLTQDISPEQLAALKLLAYLMLQKNNAFLYKQFIESDVAQNLGFSGLNQSKFCTFTVTLKGVYPDYSCEAFENQFKKVIEKICDQGIQKGRLQQYEHQFQIKLKTPRESNGIRMLEEHLSGMNHRFDLSTQLKPIQTLRRAIELLQDKSKRQLLLRQKFLTNERVVVIRQRMAQTEPKQTQITSSIEVAQDVIKRSQQALKMRQHQVSNNNVLPALQLRDLQQPQRRSAQLVNSQTGQERLFKQYHVPIQIDVNFYRLVFSLEEVTPSFSREIMLWTYGLNKHISTQKYSYNEVTSHLSRLTSGFMVSTSFGQKDQFNVIFEFSCLKQNVDAAFKVLQQLIVNPRFEQRHTLNIFRSFANEAVEGLLQDPMGECIAQAGSSLSLAAARHNSYQQMKDSFQLVRQDNYQALFQCAEQIKSAKTIILIEHSNSTSISTPRLVADLLKMPIKKGQLQDKQKWSVLQKSKAVTHNYDINFCTQQYVGPKFLSKDEALLSLFLQLLQHDYLHPRLRQQGGAYGSGARLRNGGLITLSSYLDPHAQDTFKVFDQSILDLTAQQSVPQEKLQESKIMQLGAVDRIKPMQNEGINEILKGYTPEDYANYREYLKAATWQEINQVASRYLKQTAKSRCVFGKEVPRGFTHEKLKDYLVQK